MKNSIGPFITWTPRILSLAFVGFLMLFSLDVFEGGYGFWGTIVGLLIHNIPAFVLLALVVIAWKHELVGAVAFFAAGLLYIILVIGGDVPWYLALSWSMTLSGPAFLIGALYLVSWRKRKSLVPQSKQS
ncbi:hypothetical protein KJ781_00210 [Patescibacteria group bacterium]|nr:hypothetical protein [Patescibacteria group bacterium]MBU1448775.1 hypothetical protein [Patescibacteria group bacterium]MBU2613407.1 hypothetical protein [Patescibacteria group bacterium]